MPQLTLERQRVGEREWETIKNPFLSSSIKFLQGSPNLEDFIFYLVFSILENLLEQKDFQNLCSLYFRESVGHALNGPTVSFSFHFIYLMILTLLFP